MLSLRNPLTNSQSSFSLSTTDIVIAPFWDDIDPARGDVFFRFSTDADMLNEVAMKVFMAFGSTFSPSLLFIVTWDGVSQNGGDPSVVS